MRCGIAMFLLVADAFPFRTPCHERRADLHGNFTPRFAVRSLSHLHSESSATLRDSGCTLRGPTARPRASRVDSSRTSRAPSAKKRGLPRVSEDRRIWRRASAVLAFHDESFGSPRRGATSWLGSEGGRGGAPRWSMGGRRGFFSLSASARRAMSESRRKTSRSANSPWGGLPSSASFRRTGDTQPRTRRGSSRGVGRATRWSCGFDR